MTKLSERVPDPSYGSIQEWRARLRSWLKELAEYVEFIDRRDRLAYRDLRERISKTPQKVEAKYEPRTYDEAIGLCKGWPRAAFGYNISWERDKWPELWKEMSNKCCEGQLYLDKDKWIFFYLSFTYTDSTPGRVVCQAYLVYKGHADWAERLAKTV